jgi:hypothetical protein
MSKRSLPFALLLVLCLPGLAMAQGSIGIKAGASFGNISNKGVLPGDLKTRTGWAAGLYLGSGGLLGLGVEGLYAQRGLSSDEALATSETRLDYIDLPVYLKVQLPTPGIQPFGYAGPQASYEVRCRTAAGEECADADVSGRKKWNFAGVIGAGVRFAGLIGIEGRYVYGLSDLELETVTSSSSYKHRSFMLLGSIGR